MTYDQLLREIRDRAHGYWTGDLPAADAPDKHKIVYDLVQTCMTLGITEDELDRWALVQHGEVSYAVTNADQIRELKTRLQRPGGVLRFRARLGKHTAMRDVMRGVRR